MGFKSCLCLLGLVLSFFAGCGRSAAPPSAASTTAGSSASATDLATATPGYAARAALQARLPNEAAIIGWLQPLAFDVVARWLGDDVSLPTWMAELAPTRTVVEVLSKLGIDPESPVAFAVVGPDFAKASEALDAIAKGGAGGSPPAQGLITGQITLHLVANALPGVDLRTQALRLGELARATSVSCPTDPRCQVFTEGGPDVVLSREGVAGAASSKEGLVELVIAFGPRRELGLDAQLVVLAQRRRLALGPPTGRCTALDPAASLSLCVDADRAAEAGAAFGLSWTANILSDSVEGSMRAVLAAQGRQDSMRPLELAKPEKRLLDDGTVSVLVSPKGYDITMSWSFVDSAAPGRLPAERCSDTPDLVGLAPTLLEIFPDRGADFRDASARLQHVLEGGAGAYLTLLARTWPNLVDAARAQPHLTLVLPGAETACLGVKGDRLELRIAGKRPPWFGF